MTVSTRGCAALALLAALTAPVSAEPSRADATSPLTALVDAAAQRLQIAEPVAAFKWSTHGAIDDPARVQQELDELGADAAAQRIDPGYVTRVFTDQIKATEEIEHTPIRGLAARSFRRAGCATGFVGVAIGDRWAQPDDAD